MTHESDVRRQWDGLDKEPAIRAALEVARPIATGLFLVIPLALLVTVFWFALEQR